MSASLCLYKTSWNSELENSVPILDGHKRCLSSIVPQVSFLFLIFYYLMSCFFILWQWRHGTPLLPLPHSKCETEGAVPLIRVIRYQHPPQRWHHQHCSFPPFLPRNLEPTPTDNTALLPPTPITMLPPSTFTTPPPPPSLARNARQGVFFFSYLLLLSFKLLPPPLLEPRDREPLLL